MGEASRAFATVILAGGATAADAARITEMVHAAREAGAAAVVVAVPRGWRAPPQARVVHLAPGASPISALRAGLAQLGNSPARFVMIWPLGADEMPGRVIPRERWLDLMTSEGAIEAVVSRLSVER